MSIDELVDRPVRGPQPESDPVAVVDIGSGSVKLLVTDAEALAGGRPDPLRWSIKTHLWSGDGRALSPAGLHATGVAFDRFATALAELGVERTAVVATEVGRETIDLAPLERAVETAFGVPVEVLSGDREAELGLIGAVAGRTDLPGPWALIDIGGGSTQLATGAVTGPDDAGTVIATGTVTATGAEAGSSLVVATCSLPLGAKRLTDQYFDHDPPRADELSAALSVAELHYDDVRRELLPGLAPVLERGTLVGVGAVARVAVVEIGLADPGASVDGHRMVRAEVEEIFRTLATESAADRAHNPGLRAGDVDDIVGSLCILVELLRRFGVDELVVSERDLRHGRARELLDLGPTG